MKQHYFLTGALILWGLTSVSSQQAIGADTERAAETMEIGFEKGKDARWTFSLGREFPGAQGNFAILAGEGPEKQAAGRLEGVFGEGGQYTAIQYNPAVRIPLKEILVTLRNDAGLAFLTVRLIDETGQYHQQSIPLNTDRELWQTVSIRPSKGLHYAAWGGAKDRVWHGKLRGLVLMCKGSYFPANQTQGALFFSRISVVKP